METGSGEERRKENIIIKYHIVGIFRRSLISFFSFSFFLNEFIQNENLM